MGNTFVIWPTRCTGLYHYVVSPDSTVSELTFHQQRRWSRHRFDMPVRVIISSPDGPRVVDGRGTEMSEGGLGLYAQADLKIGEKVEIEFALPFSEVSSVIADGIIRGRPGNGYYYGVEFITTNAAQKGSLVLLREMLRSAAGCLDS